MSDADRLQLRATKTPDGKDRWSITWDNIGRKHLHVVNFHPIVPRRAAERALAALKSDAELLSVLKY